MIPKIAVIVTEVDDLDSLNPKPFMAHAATNFEVRASGRTEEEAVENLKKFMTNSFRGKRRKLIEITLEELIVEDVMKG